MTTENDQTHSRQLANGERIGALDRRRGGVGGFFERVRIFLTGEQTLRERWNNFTGRLGEIGVTGHEETIPEADRVVATVEHAADTDGQTEGQDQSQNQHQNEGFFGRWKERIGGAFNQVREGVARMVGNIRERFNRTRDEYQQEVADIQNRREQLGVGGTIVSYFRDLRDGIAAVGNRIHERWHRAEEVQAQREGQRIENRFVDVDAPEVRARMREGHNPSKNAILSRELLEERLEPVRVVEVAARKERESLHARAEELRTRIRQKDNVVAILEARRERRKRKLEREGLMGVN